jgi:hypothetical protein
VAGGRGGADAAATAAYLIRFNADNNLTAFRFAHPDLRIEAARSGFEAAGERFGPGSFILPTDGNPRDLGRILDEAGASTASPPSRWPPFPSVATHQVALPRIALVHTWLTTQNEGWLRIGLDEYGVPHDYISVHQVRDTPDLRSRYDVILMGPSVADPLMLLHGVQGDEPIPWQATEHTPHIGRQASSPDIRGGLELQGVVNLQRFVEAGGTLLTIGNSSVLPIHFGLAPASPPGRPRGSGPREASTGPAGPTPEPPGLGLRRELGVYFNAGHGPLLNDGRPRPGARAPTIPDGSTTARRSGRGGIDERDQPQARGQDWGQASVQAFLEEHGEDPAGAGFGFFGGGMGPSPDVRTVFRFHEDPTQLLISGGLVNGRELTGSPALVDVKVGEGHVIMFSFNPFWRSATLGSYSLLFNALLHHGNLDVGAAVAEEDR